MSAGATGSPLVGLKREIELWAGLIFLVAGVALLATGLDEALTERRFEEEGARIRATVIDRDFVPADRDEHDRTIYFVRYRFSTPEGDEIERHEEVPVELWEASPPGSELDVLVLPGLEPCMEQTTRESWGGVLALVAMGLPFTAVGVRLGVRRARRAVRIIRAYRSGISTAGEVLEVADSGIRIHRVPMVRMRFRYRDAKGVSYEDETGPLYPEEARALTRRTRGVVRYHPSHPGVGVWIGQEDGPT